MNILITSAGQRVSLVRAFQAELKKEYPTAKVLTTDMFPRVSAACNASDGYIQVPRVTDPAYIDTLVAICKEHHIKMVVPTIDTELNTLAENKALFADNGIHVIISAPQFVKLCRDKRQTNIFFEQNNISIPRAIDKNDPTFPLFIKPYDGSLSVDTYLIRTAADITPYHMAHEKLLFMEYIDAREHSEYTVDTYYGKDNRIKCIVPRKRMLVRAGEVNKGLTCNNAIVPYIRERLSFIEGAVGCLTMQFFLNDTTGRVVGIEINPRFGGGYPLSYNAGANYPRWLIQEYYNNEHIDYTENWEDNLLMLRYDDEIMVHDYKA